MTKNNLLEKKNLSLNVITLPLGDDDKRKMKDTACVSRSSKIKF